MSQTIKEIWSEGKVITNAWLTIPSSWTSEIIAQSAYGALTIDAQHGLASDMSAVLPMLQSIRSTGIFPFVRLPSNDSVYIMRMLDAGVIGLICPMINNAIEAESFVKATKYPPDGYRSLGAIRSNLIYGQEYTRSASQLTVTMAMIETADAVRNVREISEVQGLDGLYVDPWDLSLSLGYKKLADFEDPNFMELLREILAVAKEKRIVAGIHTATPEHASLFSDMGYQFVTMFTDTAALKSAANDCLSKYNSLVLKQ